MSHTVAKMKRYALGEFTAPEACVAAAKKLREAGVEGLDAYSPYPLHGIDEALALPRSKVPLIALCGGLSGAVGGYTLQWYLNSQAYNINVANRPSHGFWTNIPITFESGILLAVLSIFFSCIVYFFRLPQPYHPVFESEQFRTASLDAFWISIEHEDGEDSAALEGKLREAGAARIHTVVESP